MVSRTRQVADIYLGANRVALALSEELSSNATAGVVVTNRS